MGRIVFENIVFYVHVAIPKMLQAAESLLRCQPLLTQQYYLVAVSQFKTDFLVQRFTCILIKMAIKMFSKIQKKKKVMKYFAV